ncbi:hypothetical protein BP00DRAFT_456456 [Aspergillus indologenus CBS 114.80]|uniref:Uncharacterized protein n=1 Tax=Aspergillus indologenus CBS 114.80 TaxID=1450541 RepID=A0A2V5I659_9EURO|nr:hypothetical protein BP00DRAFT_456456 [Aspergillus indologenus CBS 114.80]
MCFLFEFFLRARIEPVMIRREKSLERDGRWREAQTLRRQYYTMTFSWLYDFERVGELIRAEKQLVFLAQKEEFFRECERRCIMHLESNLRPDESLIEKLQTAQRLSSEVRQTLWHEDRRYQKMLASIPDGPLRRALHACRRQRDWYLSSGWQRAQYARGFDIRPKRLEDDPMHQPFDLSPRKYMGAYELRLLESYIWGLL